MNSLSTKQRAILRSKANGIDAIFQVGKGGITTPLLKQVRDALEARELIKLTVLETAPVTAREACADICEKVDAFPVQVIGHKIVVFKQSRENQTISKEIKA